MNEVISVFSRQLNSQNGDIGECETTTISKKRSNPEFKETNLELYIFQMLK